MKKQLISLLYILINYMNLYAQDSIVVSQEKAALFSNKYVFFNNCTFKHYFMTDDGQIRYGVGTYKDFGCTRTLSFGEKDSLLKSELTLIYETNFKRKLIKRGNKFISKDFYRTTRKHRVTFSQIESK